MQNSSCWSLKNSKGFAYVKDNDSLISQKNKIKNFNPKIIKVNTRKLDKFLKNINNNYFLTNSNKENLSFCFRNIKKLKLRTHLLSETIRRFKGLNYRQQIIFKKKI